MVPERTSSLHGLIRFEAVVKLSIVILLLCLLPCRMIHAQSANMAAYTYKIIPSVGMTWGYEIYLNGKLKIRQPSIPGLLGSDGFATKEAAQKVAAHVIEKISKGEMPPTITKEDLIKLNII